MLLTKATEADFDVIYKAMTESFIPEEIRAREDAKALLSESGYGIYKITKDGEWVGFITLWSLCGFTFIEHFVIFAAMRSRGLGEECLKELKSRHKALVLEAEPPVEDIQKRRIGFYQRCGFFTNDFHYIQPSYREGMSGVELVLMSYPTPLDDCNAVKCELYKKVYKVL